MNRIKNEQGIKLIIMKPTCITRCKLGEDWYQNNLEISFWPNECYPDYMEVQKWIMDKLDGTDKNIEEVVYELHQFLENEYHPHELEICDHVTGNKVHFDVEVIG